MFCKVITFPDVIQEGTQVIDIEKWGRYPAALFPMPLLQPFRPNNSRSDLTRYTGTVPKPAPLFHPSHRASAIIFINFLAEN